MKANALLRYAVKTGKIKRPEKCSKCDVRCKPLGHHPDYSKPYEVVWLCHRCHGQLHSPSQGRKGQRRYSRLRENCRFLDYLTF